MLGGAVRAGWVGASADAADAIVVTVEEVFIHCAKAFRRSKLWDPSQRQNRSDMPSLLKIVMDQTTGAPNDPEEMKKIDAGLEDEYQKTMY